MSTLFDNEYNLIKPIAKEKKTSWWTRAIRRATRPNCITHMGVKIQIDKKRLSKKEIRGLYKGRHENAEALILKTILEPGDKIVEIGAGFGLTGIMCAKITGEQNILCFEANQELKPIIENNARLNNIELNVTYSPVTYDGGTCEFYCTSTFIGSGTTKTDASINTIQKESISLNKILSEHKPNVLIVDIEGSESELLEQTELGEVEKLIVEVHPRKTSNANLKKMLIHILQQDFVQIHDLTIDSSLCFLRKIESKCVS